MERNTADDFAFLGEEFLLWLWWNAETKGGVFALGDDRRVGIALDRVLEFKDDASDVRVVVRGDAPTRAPEAREALSRGMRIERAGLIVSVDQENVLLVLDGPSLDLRSIRTERPEGETPEDRDQSALDTAFGLVSALDAVYRAWIRERVSSRFSTETAPSLLEWAQNAKAKRSPRVVRAAEEASAGVGA